MEEFKVALGIVAGILLVGYLGYVFTHQQAVAKAERWLAQERAWERERDRRDKEGVEASDRRIERRVELAAYQMFLEWAKSKEEDSLFIPPIVTSVILTSQKYPSKWLERDAINNAVHKKFTELKQEYNSNLKQTPITWLQKMNN